MAIKINVITWVLLHNFSIKFFQLASSGNSVLNISFQNYQKLKFKKMNL